MNNEMDERQKQVQGKIMFHTVCGVVAGLLSLAFLGIFELFNILDYMDFTEFCIVFSILILTYVSVMLITKDAYFGLHSAFQNKVCKSVFCVLAIAEDILFLFDLVSGNGLSPITLPSILLVNSIAISLCWKSKENPEA